MTVRKLSQKSFVSGQYDRAAQNQESYTQGGIVATGLSYAKNVLSSDKGELRKRLGTKYLQELTGATVVLPFRMPDEDDAIITIGGADNKVKGYRYEDGNLIPLMSVGQNANVPFPAGNTWGDGTIDTKTVSNGDWTVSFTFPIRVGTIGMITYHEYPGHLLNSSITLFPGTSTPQSVTIDNSSTDCCMRSVKFWFTYQDSTSYKYMSPEPIIQYSDDGINWVGVPTNYEMGDFTPLSYTPPQDIHVPGQPTIHTPAVYISKSSVSISQNQYGGNHRYWRVYFTGGKYDTVRMENLTFIDAQETTEFEAVCPYTEDQLKKIKYAQDNNQLYITCEGVIPYRIVNNNNQITFSSFTPSNTSTLWTTMGGYPAAVALFQNRLWFAGFEKYPQTVIASKFGDYETFNASSPAQYDDYLRLRCNQLKTTIRNIVGGQNVLYCFSEDGISMIDGGSTGIVATNQNIEFHLKNRMPAGDATPAFKDDVMLYSSSDGTKLYGVDFDLLVNRFQVSDLAMYAKDVTEQKITELHYLNNEAKLVYGLTDANTMFALLYNKGAYQGFFPLDFGGSVYDIAPFKMGRNYKLFMVVFRDGNWYLEEKLDLGKYIDTSRIRMTAEEKKWATYDNLENNIALDCYQTYDESFAADVVINGTVADTRYDLSSYIGQSIMFGQMNDSKAWCLATIDGIATENKNMRKMRTNVTPYKYAYIASDVEENQPNIPVYDENGKYLTFGIYNGSVLLAYENGAYETYVNELTPVFVDMDIEIGYQLTIADTRGTANAYDIVYPEFSVFQPNLPQTANVAVISEGRYFDAKKPDESANLELPLPCHRLIYGVVYEALAVIKLQTPYESMKEVVQVDVSLIDTTHLEIGTDLSDTLTIETINDSSYYDLTAITINDTCRVVVGDTPEMTKKVMFRSNKGVPFTINAVEVYVNYSNLGGN